MDRINPLASGEIPEPTLTATSPTKQPVATPDQHETAETQGINIEVGTGETAAPAPAASPERLAALSAAVAAGQLPPDPRAIATSIVRAFGWRQS